MNTDSKKTKAMAQRLSISLPAKLAEALDQMVTQRGFQNRSQAIAEMVQQNLIDLDQRNESTVMAGTITLFYDSSKLGLLQKLARIEREHIEEVISSQHVLLEGEFVMKVLIVQGPVGELRAIKDRMLSCKGVSSGSLTLTQKILPPLHAH